MNTCPNCDVPGVVTVTPDVPLLPSDVAVMVAEPAVTPLTSPLPLTVATAVLLLAQVITRPDNGLPLASFGVAAIGSVSPSDTLAVDVLTATEAICDVFTVTPDAHLIPSL